jgi:O-antigen ligase
MMMNTANMISSDLDLRSSPLEAPLLPADQLAYYGDSPTRGLPAWMVLRLTRWNLPAPLTLAVIGAALLGAVVAPIFAAAGLLGWLLAGAIAGAAAVIMIAKWRILGLAALPIAALMVPYAIGTGSQTGVNPAVLLLILLLALWLLDMIARHRQIRLLTYRPVIAALVFSVIAIVAFGFGQLPWFSTQSASLAAQIAGLLIFLLSMGAFLLVAHQIRTITELQWMTWVFLGVGLIFFTFRLFPSSYPLMARIFSRQGVLGAAFYVWLVALAFSQALFNHKLAPGWRVLAGILVIMVFYVNMKGDGRFWISGWLPSMIVVVTVILLGRPDWGLFAVAISSVVLLFNTDIITRITNEGDNTYSTITRLEAWRIMAEIIKANPVFGLGMANYYFYTPLFPILGYRISFNSHNNYIDIIAQTGLVGLFCFLWFLAELGLLGLYMRTRVPEGFPRAYVIGALGGLAGTIILGLLGDWVIPFIYNIGLEGFRASMFIFLFLGGLVAVARLYQIDPGRKTG